MAQKLSQSDPKITIISELVQKLVPGPKIGPGTKNWAWDQKLGRGPKIGPSDEKASKFF